MLDDLRPNSTISGQCIARAIYDNIADAPDELPFRKGDTLTVLEQNSGGLEGWWLCALKGMQGICPGNRLRLVPACSKTDTHFKSHDQLPLTNKVVTPKRVGDVYLYGSSRTSLNCCPQNYDIPPPSKSVTSIPSENYDSPRPMPVQYDNPRPLYDTPKSSQILNEDALSCHNPLSQSFTADGEGEEYDVPRPRNSVGGVDRMSKVSLMSSDSLYSSMSSPCPRAEGLSLHSLAISTGSLSLYDVPPEPKQVVQPTKPRLPPRGRISPQYAVSGPAGDNASDVVYDIPPQVSREQHPSSVQQPSSALRRLSTEFDPASVDLGSVGSHELPLELNSAKDTLAKLEQEAYCSMERFVGASADESELKAALHTFKNALNSMLNFARGSIGNALKEGNDTLSKKIYQLTRPVDAVYSSVNESVGKLTQGEVQSGAVSMQAQICAMAPALKDDIHHLSNTIQAHSHLIFKRSPIITCPPTNPASLRKVPSANTEPHAADSRRSATPPGMCNVSLLYENGSLDGGLDHSLRKHAPSRSAGRLAADDRRVLQFYGAQARLHLLRMNATIDAFLLQIENNQPPKVFIAHSKLVILAAHRMVYIGDAAHRNVADRFVRKSVLTCSNGLCDVMRNTVLLTKTAALQFPSVNAVQAMVDAFVSISHLANNLKTAICGEVFNVQAH